MNRDEVKGIYSVPDCRKFSGYKPCAPYTNCPCGDAEPHGRMILIVNLDFIGDVMMTTALLPALKRKYPHSTVHWITRKNALPVLENNPFIHKRWEWNDVNRLILRTMTFDEVLNADKNQDSAAFTMECNASEKLGFGLNGFGAIIPLNREAEYNYRMGLDDELKFRKNRRTGLDILAETWRLDFRKDEYVLVLSREEREECRRMKKELGIPEGAYVIGFNTGCSGLFPLKKMTVEHHLEIINRLKETCPETILLLLGGKEDTERNARIKASAEDKVIETPTTEGLRRGILYENLCDLVVTGDTLGMHLAIGLKKQVVAWFSISCSVEIELYGRGEAVQSPRECSPCWRKQCERPLCLEELDTGTICAAIERIMAGEKVG